MAYVTIDPSQTAAQAPIDQTLMDDIRNDIDDLNSRSTQAANIVEILASNVATLTAGETMTANAAVALVLNQGKYKVVNANSSVLNRRSSFLGFLKSAIASVTPSIWTLGISPATWSSGSVTLTINGRTYTQAFTTNHNTSVSALSTQLATDPDIASSATAGSPINLITLTGKGAFSVSVVVTGNPTGATFTATQTQSPVGGATTVYCYGPMAGFSGLSVGALYYLDSSNGLITSSPTDYTPIFVGQAIDTTVLYINPNKFNTIFDGNGIYVRSHGSSSVTAATGTDGNGTQDVEHFNTVTWNSGTASTAGAAVKMGRGDSTYTNVHHQLDGLNTSGTVTALFQKYNKTSWSTLTNRGTPYQASGITSFNGSLYSVGGYNGGEFNGFYKWNGTSWSTPAGTLPVSIAETGAFIQNSLVHVCGGTHIAGGHAQHATINTSDTVASSTVVPEAFEWTGSNSSGAAGYIAACRDGAVGGVVTSSYQWTGSWSSNIAFAVTQTDAAMALTTSNNLILLNGGATSATTGTNSTTVFNGASLSASVASTNNRTAGVASYI